MYSMVVQYAQWSWAVNGVAHVDHSTISPRVLRSYVLPTSRYHPDLWLLSWHGANLVEHDMPWAIVKVSEIGFWSKLTALYCLR